MGTCYLIKGREGAARPYRAEWYDWHAKPGKRTKGGSQTFATEREGIRWWQEREQENNAFYGRTGRSRTLSQKFGEYSTGWVNGLQKSRCTVKSYRSQVRRLVDYFGSDTAIGSIDRNAVRIMVADLMTATEQREALSPGTVSIRVGVLKGLMDQAIEDGMIYQNPARNVNLPKSHRRAAQIITREQLDAILEATPARSRAAVELAWHTGLRISEVCGLRRGSVDLERGMILVANVRHGDGYEQDHAKNGRRDQWVGLPDVALAPLREHLETYPVSPQGHVFTLDDTKGLRAMSQDTLRTQFRRAVLAASKKECGGIVNPTNLDPSKMVFHDLRHSCATLLAGKDTPAYVIQAQLRHTSLETSQRYIKEVEHSQLSYWLNKESPRHLRAVPAA